MSVGFNFLSREREREREEREERGRQLALIECEISLAVRFDPTAEN